MTFDEMKSSFWGYRKADVSVAMAEQQAEIDMLENSILSLKRDLQNTRDEMVRDKRTIEQQKEEIDGFDKRLESLKAESAPESAPVDDERIAKLEEELTTVKGELDEAKSALAESEEQRSILESELEKQFTKAKQAAKSAQTKEQNPMANMGGLYAKAYEFSQQIAMAPKPYVADYMNKVAMQGRASARLLNQAKKEMSDLIADMNRKIGEIERQNSELAKRVSVFADGLDGLSGAYDSAVGVKTSFEQSLDRMESEYMEAVDKLWAKDVGVSIKDLQADPVPNVTAEAPAIEPMFNFEDVAVEPAPTVEEPVADTASAETAKAPAKAYMQSVSTEDFAAIATEDPAERDQRINELLNKYRKYMIV